MIPKVDPSVLGAHLVTLGNNQRVSFSKIKEVQEMPYLIEVQKSSYDLFIKEGLKEVLRDASGVTDHTGNLVLDYVDFSIDPNPKYTIDECKERDATFSSAMRVKVRLTNKSTGELQEQEIFIGEIPLMTDPGTFVINGAERVVVSQLVRSPGVYFGTQYDKTGKKLYSGTVMPNRGLWIEYETDSNDVAYTRVDKNRKIPVTVLLRVLGLHSNEQIIDMLGNGPKIMATLEKDTTDDYQSALFELYRRLRPGEPPTIDSAEAHINNMIFNGRNYDLTRVGRYKYNKKLMLSDRIIGFALTQDVISPLTGEFLAAAGDVVNVETARLIEANGVDTVYIDANGTEIKVFSNGMVDLADFVSFDPLEVGINEKVRFSLLRDILESATDEADLKAKIKENKNDLIPLYLLPEDIFSSVNYMLGLDYGIGTDDDIDHLGNRRIRCVGELLQNQFRIGFARMERSIRERMNIQDTEIVTPSALVNTRPVIAAIREFFGSSPLSQFMDQTNPLTELTHKRRLSALGPGGLTRDRASFEVRDVHYTHYGRVCPIETPEGPNIGLISYMSSFARINEYGFLEAPFRRIDKETGVITEEVVYMTADKEDEFIVAQANEPIDENGRFKNKKVAARYHEEVLEIESNKADFMDISPKMIVSIATAMIPFLENDDANRALMGANMQRQAVPLIKPEAPIVGTGMEYRIAVDSGVCVVATADGTVTDVCARYIRVLNDDGTNTEYKLAKFMRSNQGTCVNQHPIVNIGQKIKKGDVIADGPATDNGELALGRNALIGFMTWEGYNYEDAVLINERLVKEDIYTSIHIEEYEQDARETKLGAEEITREIPNVSEDALKDLDENGIIRIGAEVRAGDILVGKVTPKGETELSAEERLLRAIFGEKAREVRDTSLRVPHGEYGTVVDVKTFTSENCTELAPGVNKVIRVYIAQKRKISVGDKMAGRHGNKGVVSRILPQEDMPFLEDGTPLDIVLNPLGVPSRMNIGQVLEVHLGYAAKALGWKIMTPVFDGANYDDIKGAFKLAGIAEDGKSVLRDGRTGEPFDQRVTVGYMYYIKLHHLVDDKIHARSTGPYSLVTQQPLGGKAQFGGQRFGEMEVWAMEAYGAAYTLQEILTVKSDDVVGRVKAYEAIVKGQNIPTPGIPESFKVLIKELQSLGLDMKVLDKNKEEIDLNQGIDDMGGMDLDVSDNFAAPDFTEDDMALGFTFESEDDQHDDEDFFTAGESFFADDLDDYKED